MHRHRLVWNSIFWIVNDGDNLVTWDQENTTSVENICRTCLDDLCFTGDKPNKHVMLKKNFGLKEFIFKNGKFDIRSDIICFEFHLACKLIIRWGQPQRKPPDDFTLTFT
jgi:hypothetical protein